MMLSMNRMYDYIKIPISIIPNLYKGKDGLIEVASYCLYHAGLKLDIDKKNIAKRLVYEYHITPENKRRTIIPDKLEILLDQIDKEHPFTDDEYRGFQDPKDYNIESEDGLSIISLVNTYFCDDNTLFELAEKYYRIDQAAKLLKVNNVNTNTVIQAYDRLKEHDNCRAYAWAKMEKIMELIHRSDNLKTEDIEIYTGNLAFKSIIGKAKVGRTESKLVLARMAGCVSCDDVTPEYLERNPNAARLYKKYSDKENFRRLTGRLRDGYVKYIQTVPGKNRLGMFFSFSRDLSVKDFNNAIEEMVIADRKKAERDKKRIQRKRKKMGCRKAVENVTVTHKTKKPQPFLYSMDQKHVKQTTPYKSQFTAQEEMSFPPDSPHIH